MKLDKAAKKKATIAIKQSIEKINKEQLDGEDRSIFGWFIRLVPVVIPIVKEIIEAATGA